MTVAWLIHGYFALNVLLYGAIAVRTTMNPDAAASAAGLTLRSAAGRAEFLTVYAGQLFALAALFAVFAFDAASHRLGLKLAILFYVPIIVYRLVPAMLAGDRYGLAWSAVLIEAVLLAAAIILLVLDASTSSPSVA